MTTARKAKALPSGPTGPPVPKHSWREGKRRYAPDRDTRCRQHQRAERSQSSIQHGTQSPTRGFRYEILSSPKACQRQLNAPSIYNWRLDWPHGQAKTRERRLRLPYAFPKVDSQVPGRGRETILLLLQHRRFRLVARRFRMRHECSQSRVRDEAGHHQRRPSSEPSLPSQKSQWRALSRDRSLVADGVAERA